MKTEHLTLYPECKPWELEPHYSQHVSAMTTAQLHGKAEIAEQLAWRDKRIAELEDQLSHADRLAQKVMALRADQNSWPKEEEVYQAMVEYRAVRAQGAPTRDELIDQESRKAQ